MNSCHDYRLLRTHTLRVHGRCIGRVTYNDIHFLLNEKEMSNIYRYDS
jgi:hypothetical protein